MHPLLAAVLLLAASPLLAETNVAEPAGQRNGLLLILHEPTALAVTLERADDVWSATPDIPTPRIRQRRSDPLPLTEQPPHFRRRSPHPIPHGRAS
jgi:hypothetical protein